MNPVSWWNSLRVISKMRLLLGPLRPFTRLCPHNPIPTPGTRQFQHNETNNTVTEERNKAKRDGYCQVHTLNQSRLDWDEAWLLLSIFTFPIVPGTNHLWRQIIGTVGDTTKRPTEWRFIGLRLLNSVLCMESNPPRHFHSVGFRLAFKIWPGKLNSLPRCMPPAHYIS